MNVHKAVSKNAFDLLSYRLHGAFQYTHSIPPSLLSFLSSSRLCLVMDRETRLLSGWRIYFRRENEVRWCMTKDDMK